MLNDYDRRWLYEQGMTHENMANLEDYIARFQKKYPRMGDCTACMVSYKRLCAEIKAQQDKVEVQAKRDAKVAHKQAQQKKADFQNGVFNHVNGKVYSDEAKMVRDNRALGYEAVGSETKSKYFQKTKSKPSRDGIRKSIADAMQMVQ